MDLRRTLFLLAAAVFFVSSVSGAVTSADRIYYNSNSEFFNGEVIVAQFDTRGDTDKIDIFYPDTELGSKIGKEVQSDLRLKVTSSDDHAEYSVSDTDKRAIYKKDAIRFETPYYDDSRRNQMIESSCLDLDGDGQASDDTYLKYGGPSLKWGIRYWTYCFKQGEKLGSVGRINSPDTIVKTRWELSNGDETITKTITNDETGSGKLVNFDLDGRTVAKVRFNNLMSTGKSKEEPLNELALHSNKYANENGYNAEGWKIISRDRHTQYVSFLENGNAYQLLENWAEDSSINTLDSLFKTLEPGDSVTEQDVEREVNSQATAASSAFTSSPLSLSNLNVGMDGSGWADGVLTLDMDKRVAYGSFTSYFWSGESNDAFLQVYRPAGKPDIVSTSGATISEVGSGTVTMTVENVGDGEGSFTGRATSCGTGFSVDDTSQTVPLGSGESTTMGFRISFSSASYDQKQIESSCTLEVEEMTTGETVTQDVDVTGVQEDECQEGKTYVKTKTVSAGDEQITVEKIMYCTNGLELKELDTCYPQKGESAEYTSEPVTLNNEESHYKCTGDSGPPPVTGACEFKIADQKITDPVCKMKNVWNGITGPLSFGVFLLDVIVGLLGLTGGFLLGASITQKIGQAAKLPVFQSNITHYLSGLLFGVLAAGLLYSLFSSIVVKITVMVVLLFALYLWVTIEGIIPG